MEGRTRLGKAAIRTLHGLIWNKNLRKEYLQHRGSHYFYVGGTWPIIRNIQLNYVRGNLQITRNDRLTLDGIRKVIQMNGGRCQKKTARLNKTRQKRKRP